jgi:hypothetical protein
MNLKKFVKDNQEYDRFYARLLALNEVEIEIIKLRTKYMESKIVDEVLTRLQNIVNDLKPYESIDTTKIDINMSEEGIN